MKKARNHNMTYDYDEYDEEEMDRPKKKEDNRRRPVRNWKKVWDAHGTEYEDLDEFHQ